MRRNRRYTLIAARKISKWNKYNITDTSSFVVHPTEKASGLRTTSYETRRGVTPESGSIFNDTLFKNLSYNSVTTTQVPNDNPPPYNWTQVEPVLQFTSGSTIYDYIDNEVNNGAQYGTLYCYWDSSYTNYSFAPGTTSPKYVTTKYEDIYALITLSAVTVSLSWHLKGASGGQQYYVIDNWNYYQVYYTPEWVDSYSRTFMKQVSSLTAYPDSNLGYTYQGTKKFGNYTYLVMKSPAILDPTDTDASPNTNYYYLKLTT